MATWRVDIQAYVVAEDRVKAWVIANQLADKIRGTTIAVAMKPEED